MADSDWAEAHKDCSNAYKPVKCDRCGREYVCTPSDGVRPAAEGGDHCCESCLLGGLPLRVLMFREVGRDEMNSSSVNEPGGAP